MNRYDESDVAMTAVREEPQIVRAARMFDEAHNDLENLKSQHSKIGQAIRAAQEKMNEAATNIRACLDISAAAVESKRL